MLVIVRDANLIKFHSQSHALFPAITHTIRNKNNGNTKISRLTGGNFQTFKIHLNAAICAYLRSNPLPRHFHHFCDKQSMFLSSVSSQGLIQCVFSVIVCAFRTALVASGSRLPLDAKKGYHLFVGRFLSNTIHTTMSKHKQSGSAHLYVLRFQ